MLELLNLFSSIAVIFIAGVITGAKLILKLKK